MCECNFRCGVIRLYCVYACQGCCDESYVVEGTYIYGMTSVYSVHEVESLTSCWGCAMAQVASCWPLTVEVCV